MLIKNRSVRQHIVLVFVSIILTSCVVWPDPYRMQVFRVSDVSSYKVGSDKLAINVISSGFNDDEAYPPYRISIWLLNGGEDIEVVSINRLSVTLNGAELENVKLEDIKSNAEIVVPGVIEQITTAPCCRFRVVSNWLDIDHKVGDKLEVTIDIHAKSSTSSYRSTSTWRFYASIEKGLFQGDLGPL